MQPHEVLTKARDLIADPARWTQRNLAKDAKGRPVPTTYNTATCFCAFGAIERVLMSDSLDDTRPSDALLQAAARKLDPNASVLCINDGLITILGLTPHQAVVRMFDLAIEEAHNAAA